MLRRLGRLLRDYRFVLFGAALLAGVYLLPPDAALREIRERGVLRACVPESFPPLVYGHDEDPGIDVEILEHIADSIGVDLSLFVNASIGADFNPRNWRVNRAQCHLIAGGVIGSEVTRGYLDTTPPHLETGWALLAPDPDESLRGATVGFYAGSTGLDRIALGRYLRSLDAAVRLVPSQEALIDGLEGGAFQFAATEALRARQIATVTSATVYWLPEELGREPVVFGLWKGDLTLKRAVVRELDRLRRSGRLDAIIDSYASAPIEHRCVPCGRAAR